MVHVFQLFWSIGLLAVLLFSTAQGQVACNLCTSGPPFCTCESSTSCPRSIPVGITQCSTQANAFKIHVTCGVGNVQLSHQAATADGSPFRAYVMSAANEAIYNGCTGTFSFLTPGSFPSSITCTGGSTPTTNYGTNDLYLIYECQNAVANCPVFYDFTASCVGGATTTTPAATTTTMAGGPTTPMTTTTTKPATTTTTAAPTTAPSGGASCFHEHTVITYKGANFKLSELKKEHPECVVPHVVSTNGVRVETTDGHIVRLTGDHLVYTSTGLVQASHLKPGQLLFTTLPDNKKADNNNDKQTTRVVRVTPEQDQRYFGLNCLDSVVLANGIRVSTFGKYHLIPTMWMRFAGQIVGVRRASAIGDTFAQLLAKLNLL